MAVGGFRWTEAEPDPNPASSSSSWIVDAVAPVIRISSAFSEPPLAHGAGYDTDGNPKARRYRGVPLGLRWTAREQTRQSRGDCSGRTGGSLHAVVTVPCEKEASAKGKRSEDTLR